MTVIAEWIDSRGGPPGRRAYLEDAAGTGSLTFAGLQHSTRAWAGAWTAPGCRPGPGWPSGCRTRSNMPAPWSPSSAPAGWWSRSTRPRRPPRCPGCWPWPGRRRPWPTPAPACPGAAVLPPDRSFGPKGPGEARPPGWHGPEPADGGIFLCTSGTTGTPKGILLREDQLGHVAASVASHHRLTPADRGYCCLPLFHINAEVVGLLATLAAGACLVLDRKFSRRGFWALIEEQGSPGSTRFPRSSPCWPWTARGPVPARRVRFVRSASAPLAPSALRRFEQAFGVPVIETYGMTEAASMITANPLDGPRKPGSAGPAGRHAEVRIAPAGRRAVRAGARPSRSAGCRSGAGASSPSTRTGGPAGAIGPDGWLDTGDLGHLDADGYLFLAGRADDVINRGGEKIYPREIEDLLLAQPGVRSAAVVGAHDEVLGRAPRRLRRPGGLAHQLRAGPSWRTRCARRARRPCPAPSGQPRSAWSRSCRWARPARSRGVACKN